MERTRGTDQEKARVIKVRERSKGAAGERPERGQGEVREKPGIVPGDVRERPGGFQ
jgi:hypothetical protein